MLRKLLLLLLSCLRFSDSTLVSEKSSVLIIGAGPAGIAAGAKLLENSVDDIIILEAEDRIGGRVYSVEFGEAVVDIGAEFCHGEQNNIVYDLAKNKNYLTPADTPHVHLYYSNSSRLDPAWMEELSTFLEDAYDSNNNLTNAGLSVAEVIVPKYIKTISKKYENDPVKLKTAEEAIAVLEGYVNSLEGSFSWSSTSAVTHYEICKGNQHLTWSGRGYKTIFSLLIKQLPLNDKIRLNHKVTKIIWNEGNGVTVYTALNKTFTADHVIFTPSLGVLKAEKNELFEPALPPSKLNAITALGFEGVMKILIRFSTNWWANDNFILQWSQEDLARSAEELPHDPISFNASWVASIDNIFMAPNNSKVLIAWVTGPVIPEIEQLPKHTVKKGVEYVLNKFLSKDYNISNIEDLIVSKWCTNPNFRGTYSFERPGFYEQNISYHRELSIPLKNGDDKPVLLFAGEATNPIHFSTVQGAIESGHREAQRIINLRKIN